ncbi:MAG: OsmC family protein, partial [Flavobacteriaceae bacterium]
MTSKVKYIGELRTQCTHIASDSFIITDAPVDNHGKGEAFSPTDTVATALASCLLTIMGIKAKQLKIDIRDTTAEVKK